jgi:sodium pump decarboxylase gamma subunit
MADLLQSGLLLMVVGMGTVFVLLGALVVAVRGVSLLSVRLGAVAAPSAGTPAPRSRAAHEGVSAEIVGVISAAVALHRRKKSGAALSKEAREPSARR